MAIKPEETKVSEAPGGVKPVVPLKGPKPVRRVYGWRPQLPDLRDHIMTVPKLTPALVLPDKVDLRLAMPPVYDQGRIGSCVSNAISGSLQFLRKKLGKTDDFTPSRLFNYWNTRNLEKSVAYDAGAIIRDSIKIINSLGAPQEQKWQYSDTPPNYYTNKWKSTDKPRRKPGASAYASGTSHEAVSYEVVPTTLTMMKTCLSDGYPFIFGFSVYESFESAEVARTGIVPIPKASEQLLGGHAVMAVGYDDSTQRFIIRNSWGVNWGDKGYFYMPYEYLTNGGLSSDFWTIREAA
jgi:C1A family cysteine protease